MTPSEINRRVAEACGLRVVHVESDDWQEAVFADPRPVCVVHEDGTHDWYYSDEVCWYAGFSDEAEDFDPYHDANDALWAAERVGIAFWGSREEALMAFQLSGAKGDDGQLEWCANVGDSRHVAFADTPSAAICNAILALKEANTPNT